MSDVSRLVRTVKAACPESKLPEIEAVTVLPSILRFGNGQMQQVRASSYYFRTKENAKTQSWMLGGRLRSHLPADSGVVLYDGPPP